MRISNRHNEPSVLLNGVYYFPNDHSELIKTDKGLKASISVIAHSGGKLRCDTHYIDPVLFLELLKYQNKDKKQKCKVNDSDRSKQFLVDLVYLFHERWHDFANAGDMDMIHQGTRDIYKAVTGLMLTVKFDNAWVELLKAWKAIELHAVTLSDDQIAVIYDTWEEDLTFRYEETAI